MVTWISSNVLLILSGCLYASGYIPSTFYTTESCSQAISFNHDVRIKLSRYSSSFLPRNLKCHLTISTTTATDNILIKFRNLNTKSSTLCRENKLVITDSNGISLTGKNGLCGFVTPSKTYLASGNYIWLDFTTDSFYQTGSFDILITSYSNPTRNGSCKAGDFECDNGKCVWDGLTCDGYNNCGDNSDEIAGCGISHTVVIGAAVGGVIFFIIVLFIIVFGARRRYYRSHSCHGDNYRAF